MFKKLLQVGMFCYSGLKSEHIDRLAREFHVYLTSDGRIRYYLIVLLSRKLQTLDIENLIVNNFIIR